MNLKTIFDATYQSLTQRIGDDGFTSTSLGSHTPISYEGMMYSRDSAIQVMAMIDQGDIALSRKLLKYIINVALAYDCDFLPHVVFAETAQREPYRENQPDGHYLFILAWSKYILNAEDDQDFFNTTYPAIARWCDYYLAPEHGFNQELQLIYNRQFEHTRELHFWTGFDLVTNSFAIAALNSMATVAEQASQHDAAAKWQSYATKIASGINKNLTGEYHGKKIYYEMLLADGTLIPGLSWANFAPIGIGIECDHELLRNTYELYRSEYSFQWGEFSMLHVDSAKQWSSDIIGKGLAWELALCQTLALPERVEEILNFITTYTTPEPLFPEGYHFSRWQQGEPWVDDPGNQEQAAWFVYICQNFNLV